MREIQARKHEVACHGFGHRLIYGMNREAFRADVCRAKQAIEEATGAAVAGFRAPTFSIVRETLWALDVLVETGFRYGSKHLPDPARPIRIPDAPCSRTARGARGGDLVEFPITTLAVGGQHLPFSGGGYFRLAPYPMIRAALRGVNRRGGSRASSTSTRGADPKQPRLPVRGFSRFRHYVNLAQTGRKLERLLQDFRFAPAGHVLREQGFAEVCA